MLKSKVLSGCNLLGFTIFSIHVGAYLSILCVPEFTQTTRYVQLGDSKHSICAVHCDLKYISLIFGYDYLGIVIHSESSELKYTNCCLMSNMLQHVALCTIMSSEESCEVCRLAVQSGGQAGWRTDRQAERYVSTKSAQVWTMAHVARITGFPTQPRTTLTVGDWQNRAVPRCNNWVSQRGNCPDPDRHKPFLGSREVQKFRALCSERCWKEYLCTPRENGCPKQSLN